MSNPTSILTRIEKIEKHGQSTISEPWVHLRTCDYLFLKEQLRTALADTQRVEWQPIETAEKGREVLVWTGRDRIVAHWAEHVEDHPPMTAGWYYWTGRMFDLVRPAPLLWMELPDKPDATMPTNRLDSTQKCRRCGRTGAEHRRDGSCLEAMSTPSSQTDQ